MQHTTLVLTLGACSSSTHSYTRSRLSWQHLCAWFTADPLDLSAAGCIQQARASSAESDFLVEARGEHRVLSCEWNGMGVGWGAGAARATRGGDVGGSSLPCPPRLLGHSPGLVEPAQGGGGGGGPTRPSGSAAPSHRPGHSHTKRKDYNDTSLIFRIRFENPKKTLN